MNRMPLTAEIEGVQLLQLPKIMSPWPHSQDYESRQRPKLSLRGGSPKQSPTVEIRRLLRHFTPRNAMRMYGVAVHDHGKSDKTFGHHYNWALLTLR
jgi:hypothetical protein